MATRVLRLLRPKSAFRALPPATILKHINQLQVLALSNPRFVRTILTITEAAALRARRLEGKKVHASR